MSKSFKDWIGEGESLYSTLIEEFQQFQQQLTDLEQQLAAKKLEVDQIAQLIGKPGVEKPKHLPVEVIEQPLTGGHSHSQNNQSSSQAAIARALSGNVAVKLL